jgi:hypothetical protein
VQLARDQPHARGFPGQSPGARRISPSAVVKRVCPKNRPLPPSRVMWHARHSCPSHRCRWAFLSRLGLWTEPGPDFKSVSSAFAPWVVAVSVHLLPEIDRLKGNGNCRGSGPLVGWGSVRGRSAFVECCGICSAVLFRRFFSKSSVGPQLLPVTVTVSGPPDLGGPSYFVVWGELTHERLFMGHGRPTPPASYAYIVSGIFPRLGLC